MADGVLSSDMRSLGFIGSLLSRPRRDMHSAFQWKVKQTGSRYNWAGEPRGLSHCCDKIPGQSHLGRFVSAHRSRGEVMVSGA